MTAPARKSAPGREHVIFLFLVFALLAALVWAHFGSLDVVSHAQGEVVPAGQIKQVQHLEGGIVKQVLAKEGDLVRRDDPLVALDETRQRADLAELDEKLKVLSIRIPRLRSELAGEPEFTLPTDLSQAVPMVAAREIDLFRIRRGRLADELAVQTAIASQKTEQESEIRARIRYSRTVKRLLDEQVDISEKMLKNAISSRMQHIALLKEGAELAGRIEEYRSILLKTKAARREAVSRIAMLKSSFLEEVRTQLNAALQQQQELSHRREKARDSLSRTVLRAPVDGIVKTLAFNTLGAVIPPGRTVMEIVPVNDRLVVEARLPPREIGFVRPGQRAKIRLASHLAGRFEAVTGRIEQVSPDSIVVEDGSSFYKVRIALNQDSFRHGDIRFALTPGVQVNCAIVTGERSVLSYLLDPFRKSLGLALTER